MRTHSLQHFAWLWAALFLPVTLVAQVDSTTRAANRGPAVQKIATASAVSTERLGIITSIRELPDGRVLVNDVMRRRLLLMDSTMKVVGVVLDSLSEVANAYGPRPGALIPYRGDTTFFVDPASYAIVVLDAAGKIVRVRSVWRVQDLPYFTSFSGPYGVPGPDARGRIIYRIPAQAAPSRVRPPAGFPFFPDQPDSAFVVAVNLDTRRLDTLGVIRTPKAERRIRQTADRSFTIDAVANPLPFTDEWAVLPDGTVAFVRGLDYRVEYLHPDGARTSSAKQPFDWQRLTDEDKQRLIDSVTVAQRKQNANNFVTAVIRWVNQYGKGYPKDFVVPEGYVLQPGLPKDWILPAGVKFPPNYLYACPPGVNPLTDGAAMPTCFPAPISFSSGQTPPPPTPRPVMVVAAADLPDYRPPFPAGSVRADLEGNLWIRTNPMKPTPGGPVFDIISPQGGLINRLQLPPGYAIAGFGRGKVVYLTTRDATGIHLARVRLR